LQAELDALQREAQAQMEALQQRLREMEADRNNRKSGYQVIDVSATELD
jgi:hypothetical protein